MPSTTWEGHLWRLVCQAQTLADLAEKLIGPVPEGPFVAAATIVSLDTGEGVAEVMGMAPGAGAAAEAEPRVGLDHEQTAGLAAWISATERAHLATGDAPPAALLPLAALLPGSPCWILSLPGRGATQGLAAVRLQPDRIYDQGLARFLAGLREPLGVALDNERHRRELQVLRRSAEADRQSLLTRLGRDKVFDEIIGLNGGLRSVMQRVEMVAGSDVPVLVLGETGAGKEVIARALHARSPRGSGPFIRVNCGAIPPDLIDSELFGHEKGSFTGAVGRRLGWFERADGGTLLLDEVGELPKAAQVRLLRVLQDGSLERVGGEKSLKVDVRIIAATHADLAGMVRTGDFREDLWYRLAVFPLLLPPLRDRRQDIPHLVQMLAERAARRFGFRPQAPRPEDLALLLAYRWPGNVRELGSVIDRAVILGEGRRLEIPKALGITTRKGLSIHQGAAASPRTEDGEVLPLDEVISRHLEVALTATGGRIEGPGGAAAILRLNPNTLRSKLRRHRIEPRTYRKS